MNLLEYKIDNQELNNKNINFTDVEFVELIINHPFLKKIGDFILKSPLSFHEDFLPYYENKNGETIDNHFNISINGENGIVEKGKKENKEHILPAKIQSKLASIFSCLNIMPIIEYKGEFFSLNSSKIPDDFLNNLGVIENIVLVDIIYSFIANDIDHFSINYKDYGVFLNNINFTDGKLKIFDLDSANILWGHIREDIDLDQLQNDILDKYRDILELPYMLDLIYDGIDFFIKYIDYLGSKELLILEKDFNSNHEEIFFWKYIMHSSKFLKNLKFEYSFDYEVYNGFMSPDIKKNFMDKLYKVYVLGEK